jgi:hypothetical protein
MLRLILFFRLSFLLPLLVLAALTLLFAFDLTDALPEPLVDTVLRVMMIVALCHLIAVIVLAHRFEFSMPLFIICYLIALPISPFVAFYQLNVRAKEYEATAPKIYERV